MGYGCRYDFAETLLESVGDLSEKAKMMETALNSAIGNEIKLREELEAREKEHRDNQRKLETACDRLETELRFVRRHAQSENLSSGLLDL